MKPSDVLPFYRWYKANPPPSRGGGLNNWLFVAALRLRHYTSQGEAMEVLESLNLEAVKEGEILRQVECAFEADTSGHKAPRWPKPDMELRDSIAKTNTNVDELLSHPFTKTPATEEAIDLLFPGDPLICAGATQMLFHTQPRSKWRGTLSRKQFIVPNPMSAVKGLTLQRKESYHTLNNTGPRQYLVTEFDSGNVAEQLRVILHLRNHGPTPGADVLPLKMVLHSGGKSIHAWWEAAAFDPTDFFRRAVVLGADPHTWLKSQFVRMPDGWRKDKARVQHILYFAQ
jgi:hypothetical protein